MTSKVLDSALRLLARREHSARELGVKLKQRGYGLDETNQAITTCQTLGYQSDSRFVASYCRSRIRQGYGPVRIFQELKTKGIDQDLIHDMLRDEAPDWVQNAIEVVRKKCKGGMRLSIHEKQKLQRFLMYRGFDTETVAHVLREQH